MLSRLITSTTVHYLYLRLKVLIFRVSPENKLLGFPFVYLLSVSRQRTNVRARLPENVQLPAAAVSVQRGRGLGGGRGHPPPALQPLSNNK